MIRIVKRNGSTEPLSEEKYNRVVMWGVEGIRNVSASAVAMGAAASIFDGMTTSQLHEALVKSAADLISPETPNYSQVAARLNMFKIRKDAFGEYTYPSFYHHIVSNVSRGVYDEDLLKFLLPRRDLQNLACISNPCVTNSLVMPQLFSWRVSTSSRTESPAKSYRSPAAAVYAGGCVFSRIGKMVVPAKHVWKNGEKGVL
ncbi:ATP cone domain-containing protein [Klebsiella pneumoniae]|uniref:ATP cone domain-containing protein n=1 Tax=Klebsiella pneumoniae TaxID=573 RepID=UPI003F6E04F6